MATKPTQWTGREIFEASDIAHRAVPVIRTIRAGHLVLSDLIERLDKSFPSAAGTWDDFLLEPIADDAEDDTQRPTAERIKVLAEQIIAHAHKHSTEAAE